MKATALVFVLLFVFVVFADVFFVVDFDELEHGAGFGEVEAFGGGFDGADLVGSVGVVVEAPDVAAGDLEAVEEGGGALVVELPGGEGVDDDGESDLDGFAVFEGGEFDVLAGDEVGTGGFGVAEAAVTVVEVVVEVAVGTGGEGGGGALEAIRLDVSAERELHVFSFLVLRGQGGTPYCLSVS
jgi:hypothetical protein